ncbi:MAG TPA: RdgB/HAM1 family non-canonical purine NTP pyrophosphatase [Chryseolinea sp.]
MIKLCFATNNSHKLEEVRHVIKHFQIVSLEEIDCFEELPETRDTLEGNSLQKAEYVFDKYKIPCFADDTGLEVEALNNAPGVYSARYAGPQRNADDNIALLHKNLQGKSNLNARFRTVISLVGLQASPILFEGIVSGSITLDRRGTSGFGYDPVFLPQGYAKTFAEMSLDEKNKLSHRARAVKKLESYLANTASITS